MVEPIKKLWAENWVRAIVGMLATISIAYATTVITISREQVRQEEQIKTIQLFISDSNSYLRNIDQRLSRIEGQLDVKR